MKTGQATLCNQRLNKAQTGSVDEAGPKRKTGATILCKGRLKLNQAPNSGLYRDLLKYISSFNPVPVQNEKTGASTLCKGRRGLNQAPNSGLYRDLNPLLLNYISSFNPGPVQNE